jgi:hypothetical protein
MILVLEPVRAVEPIVLPAILGQGASLARQIPMGFLHILPLVAWQLTVPLKFVEVNF